MKKNLIWWIQSQVHEEHLIRRGDWQQLECSKSLSYHKLECKLLHTGGGVSYHTLGTVSPFPWEHGSPFYKIHLAKGGVKALTKGFPAKNGSVHPQLLFCAMSHKAVWVRPGPSPTLKLTVFILVPHSGCPGRGNCGIHFFVSPGLFISPVEMQ